MDLILQFSSGIFKHIPTRGIPGTFHDCIVGIIVDGIRYGINLGDMPIKKTSSNCVKHFTDTFECDTEQVAINLYLDKHQTTNIPKFIKFEYNAFKCYVCDEHQKHMSGLSKHTRSNKHYKNRKVYFRSLVNTLNIVFIQHDTSPRNLTSNILTFVDSCCHAEIENYYYSKRRILPISHPIYIN